MHIFEGEEPQRGFKGIWIPAEVIRDRTLSWTERIVLIEVNNLDNDHERGCFASNRHLAELLEVGEGTVANTLSSLRKKGRITDLYFDGRSRGLRAIFLGSEPLKNPVTEPSKADLPQLQPQPEAVTSVGNGTSLDRESLSYKSKDLEKREETPLSIFKKEFPDHTPSCYQEDLLAGSVTDLSVWGAVCCYWKGNNNSPKSIGSMLEKYSRDIEKAQPQAARAVVNDSACPICENGFQSTCPYHGGTNGGS